MEIKVVDSPPHGSRRRGKYAEIWDALAGLPPGKELFITPCPGKHALSPTGGLQACGFQLTCNVRRYDGLMAPHTQHRDGGIYLYYLKPTNG